MLGFVFWLSPFPCLFPSTGMSSYFVQHWDSPGSFHSISDALAFQNALKSTFLEIKQILIKVLGEEGKLPGDLLHESTIACSTADTIAARSVDDMTLQPRDPM